MDIAIIGQGGAAAESRTILRSARFDIGETLVPGDKTKCPVILGELPGLFSTALSLLEAGRHLLLAAPQSLSPSQMQTLLDARKAKASLFLWSGRRFHPAYHLTGGLVQAGDQTWRPRYIRHETLSAERPSTALLRWTAIESISLILGLVGLTPQSVAGSSILGDERGYSDFVSFTLQFEDFAAFFQVSLGEGGERRETVLAAARRRAYIDELNQTVPVRLVDDDINQVSGTAARWVSCPSLRQGELAHKQCLAFLEATAQPALAEIEANLWQRTFSTWQACEKALLTPNRSVSVNETAETGLRIITGGGQESHRPAPALRVLFS